MQRFTGWFVRVGGVLLILSTVIVGGRVWAQGLTQTTLTFAPIGVVRGQTVRVNALHRGTPDHPDRLLTLQLVFNGEVVKSVQVTVPVNKTAAIELNLDSIIASSKVRGQLIARIIDQSGYPGPVCIIASVEVYSNTTRETLQYYADQLGAAKGVEEPPGVSTSGVFGLVRGQRVWATLYHEGDPSHASAMGVAEVYSSDGQLLKRSQVELAPGGSLVLTLNADTVLKQSKTRGYFYVVLTEVRPADWPSPYCFVGTIEAADNLTGLTDYQVGIQTHLEQQ